MNAPQKCNFSQRWSQWRCAVPRLWCDRCPVPRRAAHGLEVALAPAPLARRANWLMLLLQVVYALELTLRGHWLAAVVILLLAAAHVGLWIRGVRCGPDSPRRLLMAADGRLHVLTLDGQLHPVTLSPRSQRLGAQLLLLLCNRRHTYRVLLGPGNVDAVALAALVRRLPSAAATSALHSVAPTSTSRKPH